MSKLSYASSTFILNAGRGHYGNTLIVANGYLLADAAFVYATNVAPSTMEDIKTSIHVREMKLIGFISVDDHHNRRGTGMKAFDGIELGRYGEYRLYEEIPWMQRAVSSPRKELVKELRKTISREGNRYLREQFIKQGEAL
jgi:hypothetical protein